MTGEYKAVGDVLVRDTVPDSLIAAGCVVPEENDAPADKQPADTITLKQAGIDPAEVDAEGDPELKAALDSAPAEGQNNQAPQTTARKGFGRNKRK
ncbi:MAG: hypothetical protein AB7H77_07500 [Bdellovibrionales bacterium]